MTDDNEKILHEAAAEAVAHDDNVVAVPDENTPAEGEDSNLKESMCEEVDEKQIPNVANGAQNSIPTTADKVHESHAVLLHENGDDADRTNEAKDDNVVREDLESGVAANDTNISEDVQSSLAPLEPANESEQTDTVIKESSVALNNASSPTSDVDDVALQKEEIDAVTEAPPTEHENAEDPSKQQQLDQIQDGNVDGTTTSSDIEIVNDEEQKLDQEEHGLDIAKVETIDNKGEEEVVTEVPTATAIDDNKIIDSNATAPLDNTAKANAAPDPSTTAVAVVSTFSEVPATQIIQGCIHSVLTVMRSDYVKSNSSSVNTNINDLGDEMLFRHPIYVQLLELLETIATTTTSANSSHKNNHHHPAAILSDGRHTPSSTFRYSDDDYDGPHSTGNDEEDDGIEEDGIDGKGDDDEEDNDDEDEDDEEEDEDDGDDVYDEECAWFLHVFCGAVKRRDVSAGVTSAILASLHKFVVYDILVPFPIGSTIETGTSKDKKDAFANVTDEDRDRLVGNGIRLIANSLIDCAFEDPTANSVGTSMSAGGTNVPDTATVPLGAPPPKHSSSYKASASTMSSSAHEKGERLSGSAPPTAASAPTFATPSPDSEHCVLRLLDVIVASVEYSTRRGSLLPPSTVTGLMVTCLNLCHHRAVSASSLLRSASSAAADNVVRIVFKEKIYTEMPDKDSSLNKEKQQVQRVPDTHRLSILRRLHELLFASTSPKWVFLTINVLKLLSTALESTRGQSIDITERTFLQEVMFKILLSTAIDARDGSVLKYSMRAVFNLWVCMRTDLKCEFEVFLQSVHFRLLESWYKEELAPTKKKRATAAGSYLPLAEAREIVLENMLDICRLDPEILREIYYNYDCDPACSNLYECLMAELGKNALPLEKNSSSGPDGTLSSTTFQNPANEGSKSIDSTAAELPTQNHPPPIQTLSSSINGNSTYEASSSGKRTPLNHVNRVALDGILTALYAIPYPSARKESEEKNESETGFESTIVQVSTRTKEAISISDTVLQSRRLRKLALQKVANAFNENPGTDDWLKLSVQENLMPVSYPLSSYQAAKVAAEILHSAPDIDKTKLGTYLSIGPDKRYPFQLMVRKEFASLHDFTGMTFPVALRSFLSKFRMPGEAQCIDRIMEVFSREFYAQQSESTVFKNSDSVYVLAFSTIMLNTDLHNRTIKEGKRMTRDQFVRNNRGINAGEDLDESFLMDLYDQIKDREIQVRREAGEFVKKSDQEDFRTIWDGLQSKKREMESPVLIHKYESRSISARVHDQAMFVLFLKSSLRALKGVFVLSKDDSVVVKTLTGLRHIVKVAAAFGMDSVLNEVIQILLTIGREYIMAVLALDYAAPEDGASVGASGTKVIAEVSDDDGYSIDPEQPIPYGLLHSNKKRGPTRIAGSAAHRGLLALDCGLILFRKYTTRITDSWPAFIECLCALRDARALPEGLSELDDFADSNGTVLPFSSYALSAKRALEDHYRSLSERTGGKGKGWFRKLFRTNSKDQPYGEAGFAQNSGELSVYAAALVRVAEKADVEDSVQMGSMKLPDSTIQSLLATVAGYPFVSDPVAEHQAVFALELAARALLSDREHAILLFPQFLTTFESILCRVSNESILSPFVIERVVVAILRSSIHLYDILELRPMLRASLQLLTTTLPKSCIRVIADRMACGMAIILRASFQYFETANEWNFMGDTFDMLANYSISREFVFDGIASTLEHAIPSDRDTNHTGEEHPELSIEACETLSRILIRFTLGFYKGDLSLTVPAMLCLEKVYRYKVELLLRTENPSVDLHADHVLSTVPDKEFWQNVAVAVYAVCRSTDPEASRHGLDCFRRIILRTRVEEIPDEKWIAVLYLMVNKQPPIAAETSRGNTYGLLVHLLSRVLPSMSHKKEVTEDLHDLMSQVAALTNENLLQCRQGIVSPLFEKTLQTATYLSNHMTSDEWKGDEAFSSWASEAILTELERAGASVAEYESKKNQGGLATSNVDDKMIEDEEVSELSASEGNGDDASALD